MIAVLNSMTKQTRAWPEILREELGLNIEWGLRDSWHG